MPRKRCIALLAFGFALGCSNAYGPYQTRAPEPVVERLERDLLMIRWDEASENAPVRVYAGKSPDKIDRATLVAEMTSDQLQLIPPDAKTRYFFELVPRDGEPRMASERLLPLDGAHNFRDLGGYRTTDGRSVRWGLLYRSDELGDLTGDDLRYLSRLGVKLVCDFRGSSERARQPTRLWADDPPEIVNLEIDDDRFDASRFREMILSRDLAGVDFASLLIDGNRAFVADFSDQFSQMFERISEPGNLPTLVHCTGGKDRTGFASAIVLLALGVPRETVMRDYLLTNAYTATQIERNLSLMRLYLLFQMPADAIRSLLGVRSDYLEAGLEEIDATYGSVEAYLRDGLGLTDARLESLRESLLE